MNPPQIPSIVSKTKKGRASRGGTVEVICTYCATPFYRYASETVNKKGEHRKVFKCPGCRKVAPEKRFWMKVDKTSSPKGCWLWTGALNADGYPHFPCPETKEYRGNRIAWRLTRGEIPEGLYVLHKVECHDPRCVNPDHLYLGDQSQNAQDMIANGTHFSTPGELNVNAVLKEDDVREIRRTYVRGNADILAAKFGVTAGHIRDIARGDAWGQVT